MRLYMITDGGYIVAYGKGPGGVEITAEEYARIEEACKVRPEDTETVGYRLTEGLTWEAFDLLPVEEPDEVTPEDAYAIIFGGEDA